MTDENHARNNAQCTAENLAAMVAALECDYDRLEELTDERDGLEPEEVAAWDEVNGEELRELREAAAGVDPSSPCQSREDAERYIAEDPLSVEVRSGWTAPGVEMEPEEFAILLCTGGPACRIRGELDEHREPCRAWIEYQDWGTPWTEYCGDGCSRESLLTYCRQFYFGG